MTREEAILWLNEEIRTWENECQSKHPIKEALYAARKALEQEPVLDKIRARIELETLGYPPSAGYYKAIMKVLRIIDKYKAESEET